MRLAKAKGCVIRHTQSSCEEYYTFTEIWMKANADTWKLVYWLRDGKVMTTYRRIDLAKESALFEEYLTTCFESCTCGEDSRIIRLGGIGVAEQALAEELM